jgi:acyl-CoA thioester hydrolase
MLNYELEFPIKDVDIDVLGHVNNITYIHWVRDVALWHSLSVGLDLDAYQRFGAVFVVRQHTIDYLQSITPGGSVLCRTWIPAMAAAKYTRATEIWRHGELVARASTLWAFIESAGGRPARIPKEVFEWFGVPGAGKRQANGEWLLDDYGRASDKGKAVDQPAIATKH